jgi:hypothetical protein
MLRYEIGNIRLAACVALALAAAAPAPAPAQVVSLTVGLNTGCPYGVPN